MFDVVVIGAANIDVKAKLDAPFIPATSNIGKVNLSAGGVGRNIAHNLASLGAKVSLISVFGEDSLGEILRAETKAAGVDLSKSVIGKLATSTYVATLSSSGELITAVNDMRTIELLLPAVVEAAQEFLSHANWIVADCNLPVETLRALAKRHGNRLLIEPVSVPKSGKILQVLETDPIAMITPNLDQLQKLTKLSNVAEACHKLQSLGIKEVVVHRGPAGATFASSAGEVKNIPQPILENVVDVTGAGDAAVAGLVYGLINNFTLEKSVKFGQAMARGVLQTENSVLNKSQAIEIQKSL